MMIDLYPSKPASATAIVRDPGTISSMTDLDRITLYDAQWAASEWDLLKNQSTL
jgi:hypothetical protein